MRLQSIDTIRKRTKEQSFMWMLYNAIQEGSKFDPIEILSNYFENAFSRELSEDDIESDLIDKIRYKLLENGGILKPILKDSHIWRTIKQEIIFE